MPQITLEIVSMDSERVAVARLCLFDGNGGSIGRDEGSTFVLSDQHRRVSRLHAAVTFPLGVPTITNASTSLPITIREVELDWGQTATLASGDILGIGPYILRVCPTDTAARESGTMIGSDDAPIVLLDHVPADSPLCPFNVLMVQSGQRAVPAPAASADSLAGNDDDPFASLFSGIDSSQPGAVAPSISAIDATSSLTSHGELHSGPAELADTHTDEPLASLFPIEFAESKHFDSASGISLDPLAALGIGSNSNANSFSLAVNPAPPSAMTIPEDFNPFDLPSEIKRNSADPLASLWGGVASHVSSVARDGEPSIDSLFAAAGSSAFDGMLNGASLARQPLPGLSPLLTKSDSSDPLAMFGDSAPVQEGWSQPVRDDLAEIGGAYRPPLAFELSQPTVSAPDYFSSDIFASPTSAASKSRANNVLTEAFIKGANLSASALPEGLTPEIMVVVGSLLRSATAGAVDMLAARAATKLEVQANVTIISAQSNNPLKFLPNGDVALRQLLTKKMPGFMPADEAMRDAFDDLRAHEVGVIAGTRAALVEVLEKFDPAALAERLTADSLLETLLPSVRKTKLWNVYVERYEQIRSEAEDDFQSIFGRAFLQAYDRETALMKVQTAKGRGE